MLLNYGPEYSSMNLFGNVLAFRLLFVPKSA